MVSDVIRGDVEFPCAAMDDFVAVKASGAPLFVLANVVDDIDMAITHVIRGEDLLPTTPTGVLVWEALAIVGWTTDGSTRGGADRRPPALPVFAHLPMLVNEQRKKLSKRRDPVAVESYRDQGYLPEPSSTTWACWDGARRAARRCSTPTQMVAWFRLEDVNHSPAFFDVDKLTHINGEYIRAMTTEAFIEACPAVAGGRPGAVAPGQLRRRGLRPDGPTGAGAGGHPRRGAGHGRLPVPRRARASTRRPGPRPSTDDPLAVTILAAAIEAYEGLTGRLDTTTSSTPPPRPWRRGWGASWARPRPRSGWPSPGDGWALRCSRPSRSGTRSCPRTGSGPRSAGPGEGSRDAVSTVDTARPDLSSVSQPVTTTRAGPLRRAFRLVLRIVAVALAVVVAYLVVTAVQVWLTGRRYEPHRAGAIVVMGAAQYDGVPSPDLAARLDQAEILWQAALRHRHHGHRLKEPGDRFTEAQASARYLMAAGVPGRDIFESGGSDSWENLAQAAPTLMARGDTTVLIVTDPFHEARSLAIATDVGLRPYPTPAQHSPITGASTIPYYAKETVGVAVGRIIGFDRLSSLHTSFGSVWG